MDHSPSSQRTFSSDQSYQRKVDTMWPTLKSFLDCNHYPPTLSSELFFAALKKVEAKMKTDIFLPLLRNSRNEICLHPRLWPEIKMELDRTLAQKKCRKGCANKKPLQTPLTIQGLG